MNDARANNAAIHATGECSVLNTTKQTGTWKSTNCNILHDGNQGCGTVFTEPANYGAEFNANGGGVYALEWTSSSIKIWFFPASSVPSSLLNGATPDTALFGTPSASFGGPCSERFGEKFFNHSIVIDTTFCSGWAGGTFGTGSSYCPVKEGLSPVDSCVDYVANNPGAFKDAYWGIRSIRVWEKVQGYVLPGLATPGIALPTQAIESVDTLSEYPLFVSEVTSTPVAVYPLSRSTRSIKFTPTTLDIPTVALSSPSAVIPAGTDDVVIEPTGLSKPSAVYEPLNISPLTGGVLSVSPGSKNEFTEENHSGLDEPEVGSTVASSAGLVGGVYHGIAPPKIFDTASSATLPSIAGTKNTEGPLLPATSLRSQKGKKNGYAGVVPPARLQTLSPSVDANGILPNTATLVIPAVLSSPDNVPVSEIADIEGLPSSSVPVVPIETEIVGPQPLKNSNPLIPVNSNPGVVPSVINQSPISTLWDSLDNELKGELIAAATKLPVLPPGSNFLHELWASLDPILQGKILLSANNLPSTPSDSSGPKISDLIAAASSAKVPSAPVIPIPVPSPGKLAGNGLLGFLDAATKEKLKAVLATAASNPAKDDGIDRRQIIPVVGSLAGNNVAVASTLPLSNVFNTAPQVAQAPQVPQVPQVPQAPQLNLTLAPNVSVAALTSTDTTQAMTGLLSFLDDSTKAQIADLLLADDTSTADVSQVHRRSVPTNSQPPTKRGGSLRARQATSNWTTQDKLALAQNVYTLCPTAALIGIPFPSAYELASDLLNPNKTLEDATAAFQRKLQAYFDVTVQGCWSKINQWLAWRQLLRKPGYSSILPYYGVKPRSIVERQEDESSGYPASDTNAQGLLEQQIYTICPKPESFSTDNLISDLEDDNISIDVAIGNFQNKLWEYMAKLQSCSDKIRSYGPKLKELVSSSEEPIYHITDGASKKPHTRRELPNLTGLSPFEILDLLNELEQTGRSYADLAPEDQKDIYDAILSGLTQGQTVDPHTLEQLQNLALWLPQATVPLPASLTGIGGNTSPSNGDEPSDDDEGDNGAAPGTGADGEDDQGDDNSDDGQEDDSGSDIPGDDDGSSVGADDDGDGGDDAPEDGPGGDDDNSEPEAGDDGEGSIEPDDDSQDGSEPDDDGDNSIEPGDDGKASAEPDDDQSDPNDDSDTGGEGSGNEDATEPPSEDTTGGSEDQNDVEVGVGSGSDDDAGDESDAGSGNVEDGSDGGGEGKGNITDFNFGTNDSEDASVGVDPDVEGPSGNIDTGADADVDIPDVDGGADNAILPGEFPDNLTGDSGSRYVGLAMFMKYNYTANTVAIVTVLIPPKRILNQGSSPES